MEQLTWQTAEAARRGLAEIEHRISGGVLFDTYLGQLQRNGPAQCTTVWTRKSVAYRCRTCQVNDSSAICVNCFQAGDHRHHDYIMYHSDSGGSCDCGDSAAWKEEGFCCNHSANRLHEESTVSPSLKGVTCQAVQFVLRELSLWVERIEKAKSLDPAAANFAHELQMAQIYVVWLQKICSVTALRTIICNEIMHGRSPRESSGQSCCLDSFLSSYSRMPESLMEAETTLFLQLLYDPHFKDQFSRALMRHYADLIFPAVVSPDLLSDYKTVDQSLDRVMVQLFNVPETTLNLIQTDHLLEAVTSVLGSIIKYCTHRDAGTINVNHLAVKEKIYGRPLGDLKLMLAHEAVSLYVLNDRPDIFQTILSIYSMIQWMNPYQSESVDVEEQVSWTQAIPLEMNMMGIVFGLISRCFSAFPASGDASRSGLVSAACLTMSSLREFLTKANFSSDAVSLHIPLHRTFSAITSKLLLLSTEEGNDGFLSSLNPAFEDNEILELMDHPLRVVVWMAQIRAQMWRSNPDELSRLEFIYRGSIWHAQSMDMDIHLLQFCSVARENIVQSVVLRMAQRFDLLELVTVPKDAAGLRTLLTSQRVSMIHDFLRLMSLVVRERRNTGMDEKESLRYDVIQWLCYREHTYTQLAYSLGNLIDQPKLNEVLEEVAIYVDPKLQERGFYQLKPERWEEFDPSFAHFYMNHLEEAQERALSIGRVPHHWRLKTPRAAKPPFDRLIRLLHTEACHHLIWNVLHSVTVLIRDEITATSAEALGVMALQLLGMILDDFREREGTMPQPSMTSETWESNPSTIDSRNNVSKFIYSKPRLETGGSRIDWDQQHSMSACPSVYEMLCHLHQVKDSLRLVDLADHTLRLLNTGSSRTSSTVEPSTTQISDSVDDEQRKQKKQRQEAILANFAARQKAFLKNVVNENESEEVQDGPSPINAEVTAILSAGEGSAASDPLSEDRSSREKTGRENDPHECAFCRSECDGRTSPTGWIAWVQRYNIPGLIHSRGKVVHSAEEVNGLLLTQNNRDEKQHPDSVYVVCGSPQAMESYGGIDVHPTEHIRCCGHQMHQACFQRYAESLVKRHCSRSPYEGKGIIDLGNMDFFCPICRRLANVLLPDVNQVIPWNALRVTAEETGEAKLSVGLQNNEENTSFINLSVLFPHGSSALHDSEYWKDYWRNHESITEAVVLFVSQCLRVRNAFLKEPPELEEFSLSQILWEAFAENIVHCEIEAREASGANDIASSSGSSAPEAAPLCIGDAAHWRALTELGKLAMLTNTMPCTAKHQKRLQLLLWIGFDEVIFERWKGDSITPTGVASEDAEKVEPSDSQQAISSSVEETVDSKRRARANQKSIETPELAPPTDSPSQIEKEPTAEHGGILKSLIASGAKGKRMLRNPEQEEFEIADTTSIGWLWNKLRPSGHGELASKDPFELLIMLLATGQGWPSFQDVMTLVRMTYVVAATQASVAFDKLSRDGGVTVGTTKDEVLQLVCLPFLRRVALLVQIVTGENVILGNGGQDFRSMDSPRLQRCLSLPSATEAANLGLEGKHGMNLEQLWRNDELGPLLYRSPRRALFTDLPDVFQELVLSKYDVACPNCQRKPIDPAMCIVCGSLTCLAQECCNVDGKGECYRHADKEGAGVGLFLLMRSTRLILLRGSRVCVFPSLYLDLHGEEDSGLKRGLPLYLSSLRVNEIRRLWVTAAFDHDTYILHKSQLGAQVL